MVFRVIIAKKWDSVWQIGNYFAYKYVQFSAEFR